VTRVARSADDLTAEWLSTALATDVRSARIERIGTGQTSSTYRLRIDADGMPQTMVAKLAEGDDDARRRVATAHRSEVGFYRELAPTLGVRVPACWYADISADATLFTLLLEDLSPRVAGRQADGCSAGQATAAVRNLARLHASRWNDEALRNVDFLVPLTRQRATFLAELVREATQRFVARYAGHLRDSDKTTLYEVAEVLLDWQVGHTEPFSVIHGDYRLDNLMFHPGGRDVVAVDWQTTTVALPARDLAYFIGTSLPTEQRQAMEDELVLTYHKALQEQATVDYAYDRCVSDYRVGHLHGPMITVLGSMTSTGPRGALADEMFLSMARRSCAAVRDLRSIDAV
jgi:aminoglycoside phosphotransferase (APT) family kinase protein